MQCTATAKRTGKPCQAPAIKGKDKCRVHGGMTPVKHGLFSRYPEAVVGDHLRAAREMELKEILKESAALLGAVLSAWTEKGIPFDVLYYRATCALAGRLTAAIKAHEEIKKMNPGADDFSDVDRWLNAISGGMEQAAEEVWEDEKIGGESEHLSNTTGRKIK